MTAYNTIVVGTDGSPTSYRAVTAAAELASASAAHLVIACAYFPTDDRDVGAAADALKDEAYQIRGMNPVEEVLRTASEHARAVGVTAIDRRCVAGDPVESLVDVARDVEADLLVVGNRGLNTMTGRLLGSVPSAVSRRAACDVLIIDTTGTGATGGQRVRSQSRRRWIRRAAEVPA